MKKRNPMRFPHAAENALTAALQTGDHCTATGWWAADMDPQSARFIGEGTVMPTHHGSAAKWIIASPVSRSTEPGTGRPC